MHSNKKRTTEDFVREARLVHGDKYDYSKVVYVNRTTKVCIVCPIHGEFWQRPADHLKGCACFGCATEKRKGLVNQKNRKMICGVGVNDYNGAVYTGEEIAKKAYKHWHYMITRCYSKNHLEKFPSYANCSVCNEWLSFSNFLKWFRTQWGADKNEYHLDKDILIKGNKVYSPDTCCFVPAGLNSLLVKCDKARGNFPIGVSYDKERKLYIAAVSEGTKRNQKRFSTIEEAFSAYKKEKERYIQEVAKEYYSKGEISKRVYDALIKYEVEITD